MKRAGHTLSILRKTDGRWQLARDANLLTPVRLNREGVMQYHGSCHCGNVAYEVEGEIKEAYSCNCSLCSRRGGLLWFAPRRQIQAAAAARATW